MKKTTVDRHSTIVISEKTDRTFIYPAVADSVDLPDLSFLRNKDADIFVRLPTVSGQSVNEKGMPATDREKAIDELRLKALLVPILPRCEGLAVTVNIIGRRSSLVKIVRTEMKVIIEVHWNLCIPYFNQIKLLPFVHPEILDIFAGAVFTYMSLAMVHQGMTKDELRNHIIETCRTRPELLLASLDIFNKPNIYHIRPTRIWHSKITWANDEYRLGIDVSSVTSPQLVKPEFLEELTSFIHNIVRNYAFRYGDYLITQRYKIVSDTRSGPAIVTFEDPYIVINVHPIINRSNWKPAVYLSLGYAIMLAILQSSGSGSREKSMYLALIKTWNRFLSFDEIPEQQCVRELCGMLLQSTTEQQCRCLSEIMIGREDREHIDDFVMLVNYSFKETFMDRLKALNNLHEEKTVAYFEKLSSSISDLNITLMRNNINHGKLIEILRSDNFDHLHLAEFLRTGYLDNRHVVDVSEWLLLRTLLYDLINAPKVFKNDYKMLLKVLTKVNKSLLVYIWTSGLDNDARYEMVCSYIARVMNDIFVFDRVKIYEIVSDPVECLEAEAVTGHLLNWASFRPEARRLIVERTLSSLPRNVITQLKVRTTNDVDRMIRTMGTRSSGLVGFYLHRAYRWGSTGDELTERIRSYFQELLKQAQQVMHPMETMRGGAMLLLLLAQIISDVRDGFARNLIVTEEERQIVRDLIKKCVDWDQRHFVMMVAGMAAGYMGSIDGWVFQQFDRLLARYNGGDRVMLRSVVQFDVVVLLERALITARKGEEIGLLNRIELLRQKVDPVISDEVNRHLREMASRYGIQLPDSELKRDDIRELAHTLSRRMKTKSAPDGKQ